jgi:hypothetical protein
MHSKVMQATGDDHDQIRKAIFGVSQNIFHNSGTLDTRNRMFHSDAHFGDLAIALLLFGSQLLLAWLFFG